MAGEDGEQLLKNDGGYEEEGDQERQRGEDDGCRSQYAMAGHTIIAIAGHGDH